MKATGIVRRIDDLGCVVSKVHSTKKRGKKPLFLHIIQYFFRFINKNCCALLD